VTDRSTPAQAYHGGPATFAFSEAYRKAAEKQIAKYPPRVNYPPKNQKPRYKNPKKSKPPHVIWAPQQ
jgi:hypothetical protein